MTIDETILTAVRARIADLATQGAVLGVDIGKPDQDGRVLIRQALRYCLAGWILSEADDKQINQVYSLFVQPTEKN